MTDTVPGRWHTEVLPDGWTEAAADLAACNAVPGSYLAGGTGLALAFGHRRSVDLDLFLAEHFDSRAVRDRLRGLAGLAAMEIAPGTLYFELHRVKVSLLHYPYPLLFPTQAMGELPVADARDIACMKTEAISSRGTKRDFVDLYVAGREYGLAQILEWFARKYESVHFNRIHVLKALTYFRDAELDPTPHLLHTIEWRAVKEFFLDQVPRLAEF